MAGKLGALPVDHSRFIPRLERYVKGAIRATGLPPATGNIDRSSLVTSWPMYANDSIGDCTCAAIGHMIQAWTAYAGNEVTVPTQAVVDMYSVVSGYDPSTGANDNGADPSVVLKYMNTNGIPDVTNKLHKVEAYAAFGDPTDEQLLAQVLEVFGTVYTAFNLPYGASTEFDNGQPWNPVPGDSIEGGHMVCLQRRAVGGTGVLRYITWGKEQRTTRAFQSAYAAEAFAVVSADWIRANGTTVEGLDLAQLLSDMRYV